MQIGEAISIAKRMSNTFQAFEKLDEFLKTVAAAEASLVNLQKAGEELKTENAQISADVLDKKARANELSAQISSLGKELDVKRGKAQEEFDKEVADRKTEMDAFFAQEQKSLDQLKANNKAYVNQLKAEAKEEEKKLEELKAARADVQKQMDALASKFRT